MSYAGHVLRGSSGESLLRVLEGRVCEMRPQGRPRLTWIEDIIDNITWPSPKKKGKYGEVRRMAEDRYTWKIIVDNLQWDGRTTYEKIIPVNRRSQPE